MCCGAEMCCLAEILGGVLMKDDLGTFLLAVQGRTSSSESSAGMLMKVFANASGKATTVPMHNRDAVAAKPLEMAAFADASDIAGRIGPPTINIRDNVVSCAPSSTC